MDDQKLIDDYLARGGEIRRLPDKRVKRDTLKPEVVKKREMLASLIARAKS